jgi:6-phosphogluconolactonase
MPVGCSRVDAGSNELSVFAVGIDGLTLVDHVGAGGVRPISVAGHGNLVYVVSTGGGNAPAGVHGFRVGDDGQLSPVEGSRRELSRPDADPAQIGFSPDGRSLIVTERATDNISIHAVAGDGSAEGPTVFASAGATPYGFHFTRAGILVVTEAQGGQVGAASASSYLVSNGDGLSPLSSSVGDTRSEVCWAAITPDDRYVFVTNFGDGTVSSYTIAPDGHLKLLHPVAATTVEGQKGIRDEALSRDGRYLYALHADVRKLFGWQVQDDGGLTPVGASGDLPSTVVAGLAAG